MMVIRLWTYGDGYVDDDFDFLFAATRKPCSWTLVQKRTGANASVDLPAVASTALAVNSLKSS